MNDGIGMAYAPAVVLLSQLVPTTTPESPTTTNGSFIDQTPDPNALVLAFRELWSDVVERTPWLLAAIVVLVLASYLARLVRLTVERALRRTSTEMHVHLIVGKLVYFGTILIGLVVALSVAGVNLAVMVGSLGLVSVGIGFALSDILSNFVAGIALLLEHPFTRGDFVITRDAQGTVEDIRVRATVLRTPDGQAVLIPNKLLFTDVLTNASATTRRRLQVVVNVPYDEDTARTRGLLLRATREVEGVAEEPPPQLFTQDFGQGALQLLMWFWVDPRTTDMLRVRSQVLDTIERTLREAEVDLAVPTLIEAVPAEELGRRGASLAGLKPAAGPADPEGGAAGPSTLARTGAKSGGSAPPAGESGRRASVKDAGGVQEERKEQPR